MAGEDGFLVLAESMFSCLIYVAYVKLTVLMETMTSYPCNTIAFFMGPYGSGV